MIAREYIERVMQETDIVVIIGKSVKLKKAGKDYKGCCPFHNEKTPSFTVSPAKGIYKCFGCGKGGNVIGFVMDHQRLSYPEAIRYLAKELHIEIVDHKPTEEEEKKEQLKEQLYRLNDLAQEWFRSNLAKPENKHALDYIGLRYTSDTILQFGIGYAPEGWDSLVNHFRHLQVKEEFMIRSGLIRESEKGKKLYDYFRGRIIFPIFNYSGRIIAFAGRLVPSISQLRSTDDPGPKYLNSPESELYNKSRTLYALNFALHEIRRKDNCHLVEGYTDAGHLHSLGVINTVAPCGTALTEEQIGIIKRYTCNVTMLYDGDKAGRTAAIRNGELCLKEGMGVHLVTVPDNQDPADYFTSENIAEIETRKDYILWRAEDLFKNIEDDPMARHGAIDEICRLLALIDKKPLRESYIDQISKKYKVGKKTIADQMKEYRSVKGSTSVQNIPDDVDDDEFGRWGFYAHKNEYFFQLKDGSVAKVSNFVMKPLFHVISVYDSKRIFEITNYRGHKVVCNFDMSEMTSLQKFCKHIEEKGNFLWWGAEAHMSRLKLKLYEETKTCNEIRNLGWQKEGFWAWSNGVIMPDGSLQPIDENGLVLVEKQHYFIPAFSNIYITDKSVFIEERKFRFRNRDITLYDWADLFCSVFGENGRIGIAFWIASVFRDHILHIFKNFPILNLYGPKGTGKSQMAMSMSCLFGEGQTPFNIHNGTKAGLAEHIQLFINSIAWIDEYKNSIDFDKIETLKSIYDAIGRSRINVDKGKKKETTLVNSAVIISGQEMPTADIALFSRLVFLQFYKTRFSQEEKARYDSLKGIERDGLSHLTTEIIRLRDHFVKHYYSNYEEVLTNFIDELGKHAVEDRILRNMCSIVAAARTLYNHIRLPFSYEDLRNTALQSLHDQNSHVQSSNEIGIFWNIVEALFDEGTLIDNWHFRIDYEGIIKLKVGYEVKEVHLQEGKNILKLKFNSIASFYLQAAKKTGQKSLPPDTLRYYLEKNENFIGVYPSVKFTKSDWSNTEGKTIEQKQVTTAYCFDYDMLGINLERKPIEELEKVLSDNKIQSSSYEKNDDLPF